MSDAAVECIVAGAGAVGLAVARALALSGREVLILEAAEVFGRGVSSRSSEVIHAGMYYDAGSLKAELCVDGKALLYRYLAERGVAHRRCGKLIVATAPEEDARLEAILARGRGNGVDDLVPLAAAEARRLEPELACTAALLSPSTGIIDSHGYMLALLGDAEAAGAVLACNAPVEAVRGAGGRFAVAVGGPAPMTVACNLLVNAAGLGATRLAAAVEALPARFVPALHLSKGNYFSLGAGRAPFRHLIYPVPVPGGLGTHLTLDLSGQARFGPDVEPIEAADYDYGVDPARADGFYGAVRRYWPGLPDGALVPAYAGVRPRITPPGAPLADFVVQGPAEHGVAGLVNLFGIESPGLTSSLAIAARVARALA